MTAIEGIGLVMVLWLGCFMVLAGIGHHRPMQAEVSRKIMHLIMGLVSLSFVVIFDQLWPIVLMLVLSLTAMVVLRTSHFHTFRNVLYGIKRKSWGDVCFPIAVALVFYLAEGDALSYCLPIAIMTFADPIAAWVGICYGRAQYWVSGGHKTVEGTLAFFAISWLVAVTCFAFLSHLDWLICSYYALALAAGVTLIESISGRGLDNLTVPLSAYLIVQTIAEIDAPVATFTVLVYGLVFCLLTILYIVKSKVTSA